MQCRKNWKLIDYEVVYVGRIFSMKNECCLYKLLPENNMIITECVCGGGGTVLNVKS